MTNRILLASELGERRREVIHLLHVRKTGGTALKHALEGHLFTERYVIIGHDHPTRLRDVPLGEQAVFFLRDPLTRFVSGFYCRQRNGQPRYNSVWTTGERAAFERFQSPNELARTLSSGGVEGELARTAMVAIQHLCSNLTWLESEEYLLSRLPDIFYIGFQETLNADFEGLRQKLGLPADLRLTDDEIAANRNPSHLEYNLDEVAVANLRDWYAADQRMVEFCRRRAAELNERPPADSRIGARKSTLSLAVHPLTIVKHAAGTPAHDAWKAARDAHMAARNYSQKAVRSLCYAPYTSLYFDTQGRVRVCCHNHEFPVGHVRENSIDEMWRGPRIKALRDALAAGEFAPGCQFCEFQTAEGCFDDAAMHRFDRFTLSSDPPEWPQQLEFSISNACNLECVMCSGLHSSLIRAKREHLPVLPKVYSDAFIHSLREYLSHAIWLKFLGGEPFLVREYYQIWDMMIADGITTPCHVTTNGTQFNRKVEAVLDRIPMSFAVSMDGMRPETIESIRVNAKYDVLMDNARRFREYAKAKRTSFALTYCLMRQNWREFGEFCAMADEWDCNVAVNTVRHPPEFGIYTLPAAELRGVFEGMEAEAATLAARLTRNKRVWFGEFERIGAKVRAGDPAA
jgi:MoaA/NifB/PqqE/SkfB family radical SAM enzyme